MVALDEAIDHHGCDMPVLYRDTDVRNPLWIKPALYYGVVNLLDGDSETHIATDLQKVFIISDKDRPFPHNCYKKNP